MDKLFMFEVYFNNKPDIEPRSGKKPINNPVMFVISVSIQKTSGLNFVQDLYDGRSIQLM